MVGWAMLYISARGCLQEWTHSSKLADLPAARPEVLNTPLYPNRKISVALAQARRSLTQ